MTAYTHFVVPKYFLSLTINSYDQDVLHPILQKSFLNLKAELYNYHSQFHTDFGLLFQPTEMYLHLDFFF